MQDRVYRYRPICALCMVSEHMASHLIYHIMNLTAQIPSLQRTVGHLFGVFLSCFGTQKFIIVFLAALQ
jgi:hypothetical protein